MEILANLITAQTCPIIPSNSLCVPELAHHKNANVSQGIRKIDDNRVPYFIPLIRQIRTIQPDRDPDQMKLIEINGDISFFIAQRLKLNALLRAKLQTAWIRHVVSFGSKMFATLTLVLPKVEESVMQNWPESERGYMK